MSQEKLEIVQQVFEAGTRGDSDAVLALYDRAIEFDISRTAPALGDPTVAHGHEGLRQFFRAWREVWDSDDYEYDELIEVGDKIVSVGKQRSQGRGSGLEVVRTLAGVWTIRDGKVLRSVWFPTREAALEAAESEVVELVRHVYESYAERDVGPYRSLVAQDFRFHMRPEFPLQGSYGIDEVEQMWADLDETFSEWVVAPRSFDVVGDYVLVTVSNSSRLRGGNARVEEMIQHLWLVQEGLIREGWTFTTREEAACQAGLPG